MASHHKGLYVIIIGLLILADSFLTIQNMFTGGTQTFVNYFELILGLVTIGVGYKIHEMKV